MDSRSGLGLLGSGCSGRLGTLLDSVLLQAELAVVASVVVVVVVLAVVALVSTTVSATVLTLSQGGAQGRVDVHEGDAGLGDDGHAREGCDEVLDVHLDLGYKKVSNRGGSKGAVDRVALNKIL